MYTLRRLFKVRIFFFVLQVNHIDLAPNYAGTMMGITNGGANIVSIFAPLVVGFVVTDEVSTYIKN